MDPTEVVVRDATAADAAACAAVYAPYVRDTAVSFETEPPSATEMAQRICEAQRAHVWLVLVEGGSVVGYAYAAPVKARAAYRFASEVSVYLAPGREGSGRGRRLYDALLPRLRERGYRTLTAGMTLPNPASEALHRSFGFVPVGTWRRIGWKLGRWHDVRWLELDLDPEAESPDELV